MSKGQEDATGNRVRVKIVKNKVAPPFRKVELEIIFGKGISATASLLDGSLKFDLIQKSGAWYSYNEQKIGQGRENVKKYLDENPEIFTILDKEVRKRIFGEDIKKSSKATKA